MEHDVEELAAEVRAAYEEGRTIFHPYDMQPTTRARLRTRWHPATRREALEELVRRGDLRVEAYLICPSGHEVLAGPRDPDAIERQRRAGCPGCVTPVRPEALWLDEQYIVTGELAKRLDRELGRT